MTSARVVALALLAACAHADTWAAPDNHSENDNVFYKLKIDAVTNATPQSDTNNFGFGNSGLLNDGFTNGAKIDGGLDLDDGIIYRLNDEEYYAMPRLFHLDEYAGCLAVQGAYCLGSFELAPDGYNPLFNTMQRSVIGYSPPRWPNADWQTLHTFENIMENSQRYSANWVDHFNHTRLHRGVCLQRSCPPPPAHHSRLAQAEIEAWFASCVNASTMSAYNLTAHLYKLDYCRRGPDRLESLNANERGFAGLLAVLFGLATISTVLDLTLADHAKKGYGWALAWSIRSSWRALTAPAPATRGVDLRTFDGLRVFCMLCVIIEHVCWLGTLSYIADTRSFEQMRRAGEVILMTNSTLVVQIFFLMASFLLAHKLLRQPSQEPALHTFCTTMLNRIMRISPSYFVVVWFAASWWERLGSGPQWSPLISSEAAVCRHKWWTHLLYLNNMVYPDEKCLIQTWYLAADMQLYALALALTLALRGRRFAVPVLGALFTALTVLCLVVAYAWRLVPTYVVHRPESVRLEYNGDTSFNVLYQSPLGNATGALAGLLLAHLHHALTNSAVRVNDYKIFRWVSVAAAPAALWWAALSPLMLGEGPPHRATAATLAALERPVFIVLVALALLGAINGLKSPWRTWLSHCSTVLARLSFGALLLHIPLNKSLLAARLAPAQLDRQNAIFEWFGVAVVSYAAAVPLALLVELPAQRLHKELTALWRRPAEDPNNNKPALDKTDLCPTQCNGTNS